MKRKESKCQQKDDSVHDLQHEGNHYNPILNTEILIKTFFTLKRELRL